MCYISHLQIYQPNLDIFSQAGRQSAVRQVGYMLYDLLDWRGKNCCNSVREIIIDATQSSDDQPGWYLSSLPSPDLMLVTANIQEGN